MGGAPLTPTPPLVHIILTGVLIGPTKMNNCQWDGLTCGAGGAEQAVSGVSSALLSSQPYLAAVAIVAGPATGALEKPDAAGTAELFVHGQATSYQLIKRQDSFTPTWDIQWSSVVLDSSVRLHVKLVDKDLQNDDDIGVFDLSYANLQDAYARQTIVQVRVAEQTYKQVLFAGISVVAAR